MTVEPQGIATLTWKKAPAVSQADLLCRCWRDTGGAGHMKTLHHQSSMASIADLSIYSNRVYNTFAGTDSRDQFRERHASGTGKVYLRSRH
jgi:hypothetical protein